MTLTDLRKLAVRQRLRVRFRLSNGLECVVDEHGVAQVPEWKGIPDFNLEQEQASAAEFRLDPVVSGDSKNSAKPRLVARQELAALVQGAPGTAAPEHDED